VVGCLFAVLGAAGCDHDGRVLVVVDTDFAVPSELGLVRAVVRGSNGLEQSRDFVVDYRLPPPHSDPAAMPLSFVIVPREAGAGDFEVAVSGFERNGAEPLVTRSAITGFRPGKTLVLPLPLLQSCRRVTCPLTQTCRDGACVDPHVPAEDLPEIDEPGQELEVDAGPVEPPPDAAGDASRDGGIPASCTFGPATFVISQGTDWDPTVTADDRLLVWNAAGLVHATRPSAGAGFAFGGPITIEGLLYPVAPALQGDGRFMFIEGKTTEAGREEIFEVTRVGTEMRWGSPFQLFPGLADPIHEPGPTADGLRVVATIDGGGIVEGWRTARGLPFMDGRPLEELNPYSPAFPTLSGDGLTVAFTVRVGGDDIYVARRPDFETPFSTPEPVASINTPVAENDAWLNTDGTRLYFSREDPDRTDWDLFVTSCP
jgi:hypothetical protein